MSTRTSIERLVSFVVVAIPVLIVGFTRPSWEISFLVGNVSFLVYLIVRNRFRDE